jgi:hypothetical protein
MTAEDPYLWSGVAAVKMGANRRDTIGNSLTMQWVMIPSDTADRLVIAIQDREAISVDVDPMMNPIPMVPATERRDDKHNNVAAEKSWKRYRRVAGILPCPIDDGGAVVWNVDILWVWWLDSDRLSFTLDGHYLLWG